MAKLQIEILICTIDDGIKKVPFILMPPIDGLGYIVSMQYTDDFFLQDIPSSVLEREDVLFSKIPGKGLSINRNNALSLATADLLLTADDDNIYSEENIRNIVNAFENLPDADIICFESVSYTGKAIKKYPEEMMPYDFALKLGYYPSSFEIAMRRRVGTRFDGRFGLGSGCLCAGEEDVFLKDAATQGYNIYFVPEVICSTNPDTTGNNFIGNPVLQATKGAVFKHLFGRKDAVWRSFKESAYHFIKSGANPFAILVNMMKGIWMFR